MNIKENNKQRGNIMAFGSKGKIIYSESKTVTLFGKEYHLKVTRVQKKTRDRDPVTFKNLGWSEKIFTTGKVEEFPDASWWPEIDFGQRIVPFSISGYEEKDKGFKAVNEIMEAMVFDARKWEHEDNEANTDDIIARLEKECK